MGLQHVSRELMRRCAELGAITDEPGWLTRTFHSPAMERANALAGSWMENAGLEVREDAAFNLLGRWPSRNDRARTLLLGSHLDAVRDAGKYDGVLGVLVALAAVERLRAENFGPPFHVEIAGFSDEEGVRCQTTYLGSRALVGTLSKRDLVKIEDKGIERARRKRNEFLGYIEVHIEQGPVLESMGLPVGVVTGIAGQSRLRVEFRGVAGHAGTTPMDLRHDALCGAAELVLAVEKCGVIATVGCLEVSPGASNVIPANVSLTLDVSDPKDARRRSAVKSLETAARVIAKRRGLSIEWTTVQETASVQCDPRLTKLLSNSVISRGLEANQIPSGAGHDAAALAAICPEAMLFVRCKGGVSHHPDESIKSADAGVAVEVLADFMRTFANKTR